MATNKCPKVAIKIEMIKAKCVYNFNVIARAKSMWDISSATDTKNREDSHGSYVRERAQERMCVC